MDDLRARYWLVERNLCDAGASGLRGEDFVCCEVPAGGGFALALEVFYSRGAAEAEALGMERLARGDGRVAGWYGEDPAKDATPSGVTGVSVLDLLEVLDGSGAEYVLLDPSPVDRPVSGGLRIEPVSDFVGELRRRMVGALREGRV